MIKLPVKIYRLLAIISFLVFSYAHAANDKAFAWRVTSGPVTVYLLGSIHFADNSFYPLRKEIENAFERSGNLVVELDINSIDADDYNSLMSQKGLYKDGTTIRDVISENTWQKLQRRLNMLNINYETVKNYRPGVLVLTLSSMQVMQMGFDPQLGIDAHFLGEAKRQAKKIIELESLEQQFNLFITVPDGDLLLQESLYSLDESESMMADMVRYWKQGDETQMNKLLFEDAVKDYPAFGEIYDRLIYERNEQMTAKINRMLQQKPTEKTFYFVVVGSGHLVGEKGIVNYLKEKGYRVQRF
ncbi:MAG: TraB/GumN family protein [Gammaproteobacteria bacterium]|nr:TraB/GumN family protein [Gammaproteobacteria bacterium]